MKVDTASSSGSSPETQRYVKRTINRRARKIGNQDLVNLTKYSLDHAKFMGTSKAGEEYEQRILASMARYTKKAEQRQNLFAIIMPAGHGKTELARLYGLVDVDMLVTLDEHDYFVSMRAAILAGHATWSKHNTEWFARMNKTLDLYDYSRPIIILLHHEEIAYEIGAQVLGAIRLDRATFEKNIEGRRNDPTSMHFSRMSYDSFRVSKRVENVFSANSREDLERIFLDLINANNLPIACPYKYSSEYTNYHYTRNVPKWIMRGERADSDTVSIKLLVDMYESKMIPKEAVDYYVRNSYAVTSFDFGVSMFEWTVELAKVAAVIKDSKKFDTNGDLAEIFPPRGKKEMPRANVTLRRLVQTFDIFSHPDAVEIAGRHIGESHIFVTGLLSHWKGVAQHTRVAHLMRPLYGVAGLHWTKRLKEIHSLIRTSRFFMNTEIMEVERQSIMYMDLLVGRAEYVINEEAEIEKRGGGTYKSKHLSFDPHRRVFTNEQYGTDFKHALRWAYARIRCEPKPINVRNFAEFYERRRSWLTKGGLVYNKLPPMMKKYSAEIFDQVKNTVDIIEGRHNKQSLFEMAELQDVLRDIGSSDFNVTKTMMKYETGGKERVLLPGTLVHFIVFTYILNLAEKQEQIGSVRLNAMSDEDIKYYDRKMCTGLYHVLYDWADFNEQHSADEMAAVITELNESMAAPLDYGMFCQAIAMGMYDMSLQDKEGKRHKIWNGLYSGWRGTTWINSVLNFVYLAIALMNYERIYGESCVLMVDHGGDDVDLMLSEPTALPKILRIMDDMLFNANAWKQMLGTRSEFFRNTIVGNTVYASPTRALASFIAGDWEGSGQATVRERVVSLLDQVGKMKRRGVSPEMCNGLAMCAISHWCKIKDGDEWLNLPDVIMHGRPEDNGLGIPDVNNQIWELDTPVPDISEEWYKLVVPDYKASKDYVNVIARDLENFAITITRREELAKKYAEAAFDVEKRVDYTSWKYLMNFKAKIVRKVDIIEPKEDPVLFEQFCMFQLTDDMTAKYSQAGRYLEMCEYMERNGRPVSREALVEIMSCGLVSVPALDFQGDIYYRRLVPDFLAYRATYYCKEAINAGYVDTERAQEVFKILCYMGKQVFGHKM